MLQNFELAFYEVSFSFSLKLNLNLVKVFLTDIHCYEPSGAPVPTLKVVMDLDIFNCHVHLAKREKLKRNAKYSLPWDL